MSHIYVYYIRKAVIKAMNAQMSGDRVKATKNWVMYVFIILWSAIMAVALTLGITYDWPDFVHVNYGFPMVWGTHTLNTIHGPVDIWNVDVLSLIIDLIFWLGALLAGVAVVQRLMKGRGTA